jgi:Domain of unknown function (DUF1918)
LAPEEVIAMVEVRDRVAVESEKVGTPERTGVVTSVKGSLINVRWDSGDESAFVPNAGSLRVIGREGATDVRST